MAGIEYINEDFMIRFRAYLYKNKEDYFAKKYFEESRYAIELSNDEEWNEMFKLFEELAHNLECEIITLDVWSVLNWEDDTKWLIKRYIYNEEGWNENPHPKSKENVTDITTRAMIELYDNNEIVRNKWNSLVKKHMTPNMIGYAISDSIDWCKKIDSEDMAIHTLLLMAKWQCRWSDIGRHIDNKINK